ncbi:MAG TPA: hypothetical protein G4O04_03645 [Anaerolineae bacterium]|nr:hypothetical protein [Anaerolineae bacterium]HID84340.1 hypothetical protein [Anaerolineales bacterium]HIQ09540.1 hypothetical protein [Anaerolineaceae bacterium]
MTTKQNIPWSVLFLVLLLAVLTGMGLLAAKGLIGPAVTPTPTTWSPPDLPGQLLTPTPTPGWWASPPAWLATFTPTILPTQESTP